MNQTCRHAHCTEMLLAGISPANKLIYYLSIFLVLQSMVQLGDKEGSLAIT